MRKLLLVTVLASLVVYLSSAQSRLQEAPAPEADASVPLWSSSTWGGFYVLLPEDQQWAFAMGYWHALVTVRRLSATYPMTDLLGIMDQLTTYDTRQFREDLLDGFTGDPRVYIGVVPWYHFLR